MQTIPPSWRIRRQRDGAALVARRDGDVLALQMVLEGGDVGWLGAAGRERGNARLDQCARLEDLARFLGVFFFIEPTRSGKTLLPVSRFHSS
jgi:hypothetical protein